MTEKHLKIHCNPYQFRTKPFNVFEKNDDGDLIRNWKAYYPILL